MYSVCFNVGINASYNCKYIVVLLQRLGLVIGG